MNKKKIITGLFAIIIIFLSYNSLNPMHHALAISKEDYYLKKVNISPENTSATIKDENRGIFFIHPGMKKPSGAIFIFKKSGKVILNFSIRKGSRIGDIEFTVIKNGQLVKKLIITAQQQQVQNVVVPITPMDKLEVWADKHGSTAADWGNLEIKMEEPAYMLKDFIVPFLWSLLFIFLLGKNHKYIGINAYIGFVLFLFAEKINFGQLTFENILTYMLFLFGMTFLFTLIYQELAFVKRYKVAMIISYIAALFVYLVPLSFVIYALNYDTAITQDALFAVFQSNPDESIAYISDFIAIKYIVFFIFMTALIGFLLYRQEKKETRYIEKSLLIFLIFVFFSIASAQFSHLRLFGFLLKGFDKYTFEVDRFKKTLAKRKAGKIHFSANKEHKGETYIVIIGESLNKKHMGLYGYVRDTTPNLSQMYREGKLVRFNNTYSNHTHTVFVLDLALTEANQYNKKNFYDSLSIIDILKKADVETYWLTNQPLYSIYDNMVSIIGTSADHVVALNNAVGGISTGKPSYDGPLIRRVQRVLAEKSDRNRVIFVHLGGSHTTYTDRYPNDKYTIFSKKLDPGEFGTKASKVETINSYDNSVYYNDYVVGSILNAFQKDKSAYALLYMSDHTDDVINKVAHNSAMFTYYMTQIPMLIWFSDAYKQRYPQQYKYLTAHKETLFSNDMLYDTLIGMMGVKTAHYNPFFDLSSGMYKLDPKDALVLHGKKYYEDPDNHIYWQKVNSRYLMDLNQSNRVIPSHVNSLGKFKDIWSEGFKSFASDLFFDMEHKMTLTLGHDSFRQGMTLSLFFERVNVKRINRMVFTIGNLDKSNAENLLKQWESLDAKYHVKNRVFIEANMQDIPLQSFYKKGWHIVYRLPSQTIMKMLQEKNSIKMSRLAQQTADKIEKAHILSLSFDSTVYPWIKEYLEPHLSKNVIYHIHTKLPLYDTTFKKKLLHTPFYADPHVITLTVPYDSQFDL